MYDVGIIGGGPAGYVAAERAGQKGLSVVLFDKKKLGGVCLNEGCIPTKTLLYSAKMYDHAKEGAKYGINCSEVTFDFAKIMQRKNKVVAKLVAGIGAAMKKGNIEVVYAQAEIAERASDHIKIKALDTIYECKNILLATGSEAMIPPIKGLVREEILTNREILDIKSVPESLTIIGGGVIGMEFASFFNSMGCKVSVIEMMDHILGPTDREFSNLLQQDFAKRGIDFYLGCKVVEIKGKEVFFEKEGKTESIVSSEILMSVGRKPVTQGINLDRLGVEVVRGGVKIDEHCRTNIPNVYAAGDITGFSLLAHTASREGEVAVNHICGIPDRMRYNAIPSVVYTNPEIACVGLTEEEAKAKNIAYKVRTLPMAYAGRFVVENEGKNGLVKILVGDKYNEVLGVHMMGNASSEMIFGAAIMIEMQMRVTDVQQIVFPHPTISEILKETFFAFNE
ncbi:MAG: dihydrolipoyl dehydrogenase [Bacteroidales bacterium]|nr:dihydrolipoyl dehydrogenase [Bacteroidales bacterium]